MIQDSHDIRKMLRLIKIVHTAVWLIMAGSNVLAFYFAFIGKFDAWFWGPALLLFLESLGGHPNPAIEGHRKTGHRN